MKNLLLIGPFFLMLSCGSGLDSNNTLPPIHPVVTDSTKCNFRAKEVFDLINQYYKLPNGLYLENYPIQSGDPSYSYLWSYVGLLSGAATLTQIGYDVNYTALDDNRWYKWKRYPFL